MSNIFHLFSTADKELVHSAIQKFFIETEEFSYDFLTFIEFPNPNIKLEINLEKNVKLLTDKNKRLRFDLYATDDTNQNPLLIIENKFKATPTVDQLKLYDNYIISNNYVGVHKVLFVFSDFQLPVSVKIYCKKFGWKICSYISLSNGMGNNLSNWLNQKSKSLQTNTRLGLLFHDYNEYLSEFETEVNKLIVNNYFQQYKNIDRFIYFQYLLFVQSLIYEFFHKEGFNVQPTHDGGANVIPGIAFWIDINKKFNNIIFAAYSAIDGDSFKLGILYDRRNLAKVNDINEEVFKIFDNDVRNLKSLKVNNRKIKVKSVNLNNPNKQSSVCSIFTFSILENQMRFNVVQDIVEISKKYFNYFTND